MRYIAKSLIVSALVLMVGAIDISAQQSCDSVAVYFRQGESVFDRDFRDNGERIDEFIAKIQLIQDLSHMEILRVDYIAGASPEGSVQGNETLSRMRAAVLTEELHKQLEFPDSIVHLQSLAEDWDGLARQVKGDPDVPNRKEALKIIEKAESDRKFKLQTLAGGATWDYLLRTQYPDLRSFRVFIYTGADQPVLEGVVEVDLSSEPVSEPENQQFKPEKKESVKPVVVEQPKVKEPKVKEPKEPKELKQPKEPKEPKQPKQPKEPKVKEPKTPKVKEVKAPKEVKTPKEPKDSTDWTRQLTVKTNILGAAFLMANAAVEVDIIKNLSFALPVYWSGWDYAGINTLKFRTLMIQPEIRYYIPKTNRLYVGAHFGAGYWNFALGNLAPMLGLDEMDGWRYQDHKGESPALGGGLSMGYALQFKKNPRWGMEFSLGAGAYVAKYDVFYNEANGPYHKRGLSTTFIGIDNASVSFTYKFDLKRTNSKEKEGKR